MSTFKRKIAQIKFLRKIFEAKGTITHESNKCTYCGLCQNICSVSAINVSRNPNTWSIENNICARCTHCVHVCKAKALILQK